MKNFLRWIARTTLAGVMVAGLASCGGGGVSSDTGNSQGTFAINPGDGSLYAGIPVSFQVVGGQKPYTITSNEQTVIPLVAFRVDGNSFSVIPRNPGVIDAGLQPGEVPRRTVTLTVRDNRGVQITATYRVLQNFLTGYSMALASLNPACNPDVDEGEELLGACSGFRSRLFLLPTTDGVIQRNKTLRVSHLTGGFSMVVNENTGALGTFVDVVTDEHGRATAQIHIPATTPTQFATLRVTDIATGLYRDLAFTIGNMSGALAVLPDEITLTGPDNQTCGSGQVSVLVTGGTPPYTTTSSSPQFITVTPATVTESGGTFLVNIAQAFVPACLQDAVVLVRDSTGTVVTFTVNTEPGTDPPVVPLSASPTVVCVPDGGTASIAVIGGRPGKVINTSNPDLAVPSITTGTGDFTFDIVATNNIPTPPAGTFVTISVNDGTPNGVQIAAQRRITCP